MTQIHPRGSTPAGRRAAQIALVGAVVFVAVAGFSSAYDLWRALVAAILLAMLVGVLMMIVLLLPGAFGQDEE